MTARYVKPAPLNFALREMQRLARLPQSWLVLGAVSVVMGLVGPFGTFEMTLLPRLAYWIAVVTGTTAIGTLVELTVAEAIGTRLPGPLAAGIGGAVAGVPIALAVWAFNALVFSGDGEAISLWLLLGYCVPIAAVVTAAGNGLRRPAPGQPSPNAPAEMAATAPPPLLERLPRPQRGRLIHLAVSDHYVEVTTEKGTSLVLMRLSDAIKETEPVMGLQVHRSHWVALDAVRRGLRQGGKPVLELETGALVPVSRTYLDAVRAAGLLD